MADQSYKLSITWDRDSAMGGVNPDTDEHSIYCEGKDQFGKKVLLEPKHHGSKTLQYLSFTPTVMHVGADVYVDDMLIGQAKFSVVPLSEWPNACPSDDIGAGFGNLAIVELALDSEYVKHIWDPVQSWIPGADEKEEAEVDAQIKRDQDMTAKTPLISQVNIDATIARAKTTPNVGHWPDFAFLRSVAFGLADDLGITIYTQRWPGRESGYDYTLLEDADKLYQALIDYMRENK